MEVLEIVLETVLRVLRDPLWQGVGVIIGLLLTLAQIFPERAKVFVPASAVILIMGFIAHFFAGGTPVQPTVNSLPRTPNLPTPIGQNTPMWFVTSPVDLIKIYFDFRNDFCVSVEFGSYAARNMFP
jgi:hypothetical protein